MKKIAVIGHFALGKNLLNGQTVKTKILTDELIRQLGEEEILRIDTHGGRLGSLVKAPFQALKALKRAEHVLILPAHNGLRVFAPLLSFLRRFFRGRKLHYLVIGGWLPEFVKGRKGLEKALKRFDSICVETSTMKKALEGRGFSNISILPNCKALTPLTPAELVYPEEEPYRLCTFSRVMEKKGIGDAVKAVREVNGTLGREVFTLDIYGAVDEAETGWFDSLRKDFPSSVKYAGAVAYDQSVALLKDYFALLFPTRFFTEGVPGTVIDAYAAGIPVVASRWESFADVIEEGKTGLGYDFADCEALKALLLSAAKDPKALLAMKRTCLERATLYSASHTVADLCRPILMIDGAVGHPTR